MTKRELEAALEQRCVAKVEAAGGMALKLIVPGVRGFPDRTILMPRVHSPDWEEQRDPTVWFAEFKRLRTGRVSAQQSRWRVLLFQMGFGVYFIDTDEQFDEALAREMGR